MGKKGKGGKKGAKIIDGLATNEMTRDQLMGHCKRLQIELEREREERNFFSLEREKLFSLWNMTLEQIGTEKHRNRLLEIHVAEGEKEKEEEMSVYKQKLRYLMMEQSKTLACVRLNHLEKMRKMQEETKAIQTAMSETLNGKKKELSKAKCSIQEIIRALELKHAEAVTKIRNEYGDEIRRLESEFNRRLFLHQRNVRCDEILGNLNLQTKEETEDILALHEQQLVDMKNFYNGMMTNNFAIISALQNDVEELKSNESRLLMEIKKMKDELNSHKRIKYSISNNNKNKPLAIKGKSDQYINENNKNEQEGEGEEEEPVNNLDGNNNCNIVTKCKNKELESLKRRLNVMSKTLENKGNLCRQLECENEILQQRMLLAEKERDDLKNTFKEAIIEIQRKSSRLKLVTELKLNATACSKIIKTNNDDEEIGSHDTTSKVPKYYSDNNDFLQTRGIRKHSGFRNTNTPPNNSNPKITVVDVQGFNTSQQQQGEEQEEEYLNNLDSPNNL